MRVQRGAAKPTGYGDFTLSQRRARPPRHRWHRVRISARPTPTMPGRPPSCTCRPRDKKQTVRPVRARPKRHRHPRRHRTATHHRRRRRRVASSTPYPGRGEPLSHAALPHRRPRRPVGGRGAGGGAALVRPTPPTVAAVCGAHAVAASPSGLAMRLPAGELTTATRGAAREGISAAAARDGRGGRPPARPDPRAPPRRRRGWGLTPAQRSRRGRQAQRRARLRRRRQRQQRRHSRVHRPMTTRRPPSTARRSMARSLV